MKAKAYAIMEGDFVVTNQLLRYDLSKDKNDDDLIDSCAYGLQMLERYLGLIRMMFAKGVSNQPKILRQSEVCSA
jgi:hypothetical protein